MEASTRRRYTPPELIVYGTLSVITATVSESMNRNDALQGQNNLKT